MARPEKRFRSGSVSATVWKNEKKDETTNETSEYYTVNVDRSYKKGEGENATWENTSSMRINDLPKVALVAQKAFEYLTLKEDSTEANSTTE